MTTLADLGVSEPHGTSEWNLPTFIIPKKDFTGTLDKRSKIIE